MIKLEWIMLTTGMLTDQDTRTQRIAVTVWDGRVSPVFDTAQCVTLSDIAAGVAGARRDAPIPGDTLQHKIARLRALGVDLLVCGAISQPAAEWLAASGIRLISFVSGDVDEVIAAVAAQRITDPSFAMPGCGCRRQHGARRGRGCAGGGKGCGRDRGRH